MEALFQTADWKKEKHVPVIDIELPIKKDSATKVTVTVGKEIKHPNTSAHHISWIKLFFWPSGEKFPYEVGHVEFSAHGASTEGPDTSTVYTEPEAVFSFRTGKPGKLIAMSYCNIHGLWKSELEVQVV